VDRSGVPGNSIRRGLDILFPPLTITLDRRKLRKKFLVLSHPRNAGRIGGENRGQNLFSISAGEKGVQFGRF
jgi:hypothetical protein